MITRQVASGGVRCPFCNWHGPEFLPAGRRQRPNRRCPMCGSLERHRLVAAPVSRCLNTNQRIVVVEVGARGCFERLADSAPEVHFTTVDIAGAAGIHADVTALPFADGSIDLVLCFHVLEHVPDDLSALSELRRVLTERGLLVVQVPEREGETLDGRTWTPETREERLGHREHQWGYGSGALDARLRDAGIRFRRWPDPGDIDEEDVRLLALRRGQTVHLGVRDDAPDGGLITSFVGCCE